MPKLDMWGFGRQLIETLDLDPVYILVHEAKLSPTELRCWLVTYWAFYHIGTANEIVSMPHRYWVTMKEAARSKAWPRGRERRHYRGELAIKSVDYLASWGVERLFTPFTGDQVLSLPYVVRRVKEWYGFGDWIAFKVADMLERLGLARIEFSTGAVFLFDSPRAGASLAWDKYGRGDLPADLGQWAIGAILNGYQKRPGLSPLAPPRFERFINVQEAETILCKWHAYENGHYKIGEDIEACRKALDRYPNNRISRQMLEAGKGKLW